MNAETMSRVALVTGATGAIGFAIANRIALMPGFEVVLLCRNEAKAKRAMGAIQAATGNRSVSFSLVDLSRQALVNAFASAWDRPVHVLVNDAAIAPPSREETPEGIERVCNQCAGLLLVDQGAGRPSDPSRPRQGRQCGELLGG